jgi:hypothetical protein
VSSRQEERLYTAAQLPLDSRHKDVHDDRLWWSPAEQLIRDRKMLFWRDDS